MSYRIATRSFLFALTFIAFAVSSASAQSATPQVGPSSDPVVGRKGAQQLGFSFNMQALSIPGFDPFSGNTTSSQWLGFYQGGVDTGKFVSERLVLRFGGLVNGQMGGGELGGKTSLDGMVGFLLYASPNRPGSLYLGADYQYPILPSGDGKSGFVLAKIGVQSSVRHNAAVFVEGGYGQSVSSFGDAGIVTVQVGLRILFNQ